MSDTHVLDLFRKKLRTSAQKRNKYRDQFTPDDEEHAVRVFQDALQYPNLSEEMLFEKLGDETSS